MKVGIHVPDMLSTLPPSVIYFLEHSLFGQGTRELGKPHSRDLGQNDPCLS